MANNFILPVSTQTADHGRIGVVKIGTTPSTTGIDIQSDGTLQLATVSGLTVGTYLKTTVDSFGRVTSGSNADIVISNTAKITSAATLAAGTDSIKVFTVQDSSSTPIFSVAQSGLTTIRSNVAFASGTGTDEAFRVESSDATSLFQVMTNGDAIIGGIIKVKGSGQSEFTGDVLIGGKLNVDGTIVGGTTATIGSDFTVNGKLVVKGDSDLGDDAATDKVTIKALTKVFSPTTKALGSATTEAFLVTDSESTPLFQVMQNGDAVIGGIIKVKGTGTSEFAGDVSIGGHLTVMSGATINGVMQNDTLTLSGNLTVNGNTQLGDNASTDTTTINGVTTIISKSTKSAGSSSASVFIVKSSDNQELLSVKENGDTVVGGKITIAGSGSSAMTTNGDVSVTGNLTVSGITTLNGNINLGDASSDLIISKAPIAMSNNKITGLADPTANTDAATKQYVDNVIQGLDIKQSVRFATTTNLAAAYASGVLTASAVGALTSIDGTASPALAVGDRILVKNQTTAKQNGIYIITNLGSASIAWTMTRAGDFATNLEASSGAFTFVEDGTTNGNTGWVMTSDNVILDTTDIVWTQFAGVGSVSGGTGIGQTGNTITLLPATTSALGGIIASDTTNTSIDASGNLTIKSATTNTANYIVRRDGSGGIAVGAVSATSITSTGALTVTGASTLNGAVTIGDATSDTVNIVGKIAKVSNTAVTGTYGVQAVAANNSDLAIGTSATTVATFSPSANGNHIIYLYVRMAASTTLTIDLSYNDGSAQTLNIMSGTQAIGSYSVSPVFIYAKTGTAITITATAGAANAAYISANIAGF